MKLAIKPKITNQPKTTTKLINPAKLFLAGRKSFKKIKGLSHTPKSHKHLYQSLKLKQIKCVIPESEIRKSANRTSKDLKLSKDKPMYEVVCNDVTHDLSNSIHYIRQVHGDRKPSKHSIFHIFKHENSCKRQIAI